jgi:hypothetical protein
MNKRQFTKALLSLPLAAVVPLSLVPEPYSVGKHALQIMKDLEEYHPSIGHRASCEVSFMMLDYLNEHNTFDGLRLPEAPYFANLILHHEQETIH